MKNKFITPTAVNVKEYKEKNYNQLLDEMKKANWESFKDIPEFLPSEEELRQDLEYLYNPNKMKKHETLIPDTGIDFYQHLVKIQNSDIENELIILLNENKEIIGSKIVSVGDAVSINEHEQNVWEYILSNKTAKFFIHIHNHPKVIVCEPSLEDEFQFAKHKMTGNLMGIKMLDACIISEFDFYSQFQNEKNKSTTPILKYWKTHKLPTSMIDENLPIWSMLRKSLED